MLIVGIAGKARSGKDTVGQHLSRAHGLRRYALAGPLKGMLETGFGLREASYQTTEEKEAVIPWLGCSYRYLAQTLGTEWGRKIVADDVWLRIAGMYITHLTALNAFDDVPVCPGVAITDVRFNNEAAWVRAQGGRIIHVYRHDTAELSEAVKAHASEAGVLVQPEDFQLFNYGTIEQLLRGVDEIMSDIMVTR